MLILTQINILIAIVLHYIMVIYGVVSKISVSIYIIHGWGLGSIKLQYRKHGKIHWAKRLHFQPNWIFCVNIFAVPCPERCLYSWENFHSSLENHKKCGSLAQQIFLRMFTLYPTKWPHVVSGVYKQYNITWSLDTPTLQFSLRMV